MSPTRFARLLVAEEKSSLFGLLDDVSITQMFLGVIALLLVYGLAIGVYRLYFSPLSHIPGPKIAAFTGWYETYYDVVKGGKYVDIIKIMHENYGGYSLIEIRASTKPSTEN